MKLAISGKGGVGKTTIAAGLIKFFASQGLRVYAVDADPDASLGIVLGLPEEQVESLKPIVDMREVIAKRTGGEGAFFSLNPNVDDLLADYTLEHGNILFFKMGTVKQAGTTCYCRENAVLNALINSLLLRRQEMVVLDMSAGIEHLTRGTARGVDVMLVVTEPSPVSLRTARVVEGLARELGISRIKFIANKVRYPQEEELFRQEFQEDLLGILPFEEQVWSGGNLEKPSAFSLALEAVGHHLLAMVQKTELNHTY
ncbi:CO dehydrogenase maturation factor [Thermanaeromonas toyohensis ToBE]|uniref:CO dehydrogenase maturation factor n=1 Tax=Thermanaeromonas toyohensis ToBE TaxID=698762 RepID=A0A1W1VXX2_9FIRM|nr:AAA family ATPase [Thermanaeromonas toyohensis]SMB98100.1 CO dehydrogenase maturation factor [Thermanaeromonas toyohensis ToBE]